MAGEYTDYACGQVLCLKQSNLHYLLKETQVAAYITIKEKFINTPNNPFTDVTKEGVKEKNMDTKIRMENGLLKQEINNLKEKCSNIEI